VTDLPRYTDDEAFALGLHPANAFRAFSLAPGTIRAWASAGHIQARGIGARGARLYVVAEVAAYSKRDLKRPGPRRLSSVA
jgi:hypothetical protein